MRFGNVYVIVFALAIAVFVGVLALAATGSWWVLAGALAVHALGTFFVLGLTGRALRDEDKPDPVTEAAVEEGATSNGSGRGEGDPEFGIPERR